MTKNTTMDVINRISKRLYVLVENAASKAPKLLPSLTSKKSLWPNSNASREDNQAFRQQFSDQEIIQFIASLAKFDPTGNKAVYLPYIVGQLSRGHLTITPDNPEDGQRIFNALEFFHENKKTRQWRELGLSNNIHDYKDWRQLEDVLFKHGDIESERQTKRKDLEGVIKLFEVQIPNNLGTVYIFYKIIEPEAVAVMGMGTRWCTTTLTPTDEVLWTYPDWHPKAGQTRPLKVQQLGRHSGCAQTATSYLKDGPMYMVFRRHMNAPENFKDDVTGHGGQFMQIHAESGQFMNIEDRMISRATPPTDYAFAKWAESGTAPLDVVKKIRQLAPKNYPQKPPPG